MRTDNGFALTAASCTTVPAPHGGGHPADGRAAGPRATASSTSAPGAGAANPLVDFAGLLTAVAVGDPSDQQLGEMVDHLRTINAIPQGSDALRQLRYAAQRSGRYPIMVFNRKAHGAPATLERHRPARPDEAVMLSGRTGAHADPRNREEAGMATLIQAVAVYLERSQRGSLGAVGLRAARVSMPAGEPWTTPGSAPAMSGPRV